MAGEDPTGSTGDDGRRYSPSAARNRAPVRDVLCALLAPSASVLEIGSGTGEHGVHMVAAMAGLTWTWSDPEPQARASQAAWARHVGSDRLKGPLDIDVTAADWGVPAGAFDAVVSLNMIHIAPFAAAEGLIAGAVLALRPGGVLILYGPFARDGRIAPSNARFSDDLKRRDPAWGVRDLDREIVPLAARQGLGLASVTEMPANNLTVVFGPAN